MSLKLRLGIDIDNTLTNENPFKDIQPFQLEERQESIEASILSCTPKPGIEVLRTTPHLIHLVTGRQEMFRSATIEWLNNNNIPFHSITTCPIGLYIHNFDPILYHNYKINAYQSRNVDYIFEDDLKLISLLSSLGLKAYHVDKSFKTAYDRVFSPIKSMR